MYRQKCTHTQERHTKWQTSAQKPIQFLICWPAFLVVSGVPSVPSVPSEIWLHWTTGNPGNRCGAPAEAPGGGSSSAIPIRQSKPHCSQLGKRLVCTDSNSNEERAVQAIWTGLWSVWLSQTWQRAPPVDHTKPKACWALHCVQSPRLNYLCTANTCLQSSTYDASCFICFIHTSNDRSACQYYLISMFLSTSAFKWHYPTLPL